MTLSIDATLDQAGKLVTVALNALFNGAAGPRSRVGSAIALIDTVAESIPRLMADIASPGAAHVEGDVVVNVPSADHSGRSLDQRAYDLGLLLKHASRLLSHQPAAGANIGEEVMAILAEAALKLDAVSRALEGMGEPDAIPEAA